MTGTSKLAAAVFAFFSGVIGAPEKVKSRTSVRATLPNATCQAEWDALNDANDALADAQAAVATANTFFQIAQQAHSVCEMQTPGNCQQEAADLAVASAGVVAAQQVENQKATAQYNAQAAYYACLYGY